MVGPPPDSWKVPPERARAFELAPGVWQLRLPLPWPLVPHVNAYWLAGERVLVDCGSAGHPSHRASLSAALALAGASVEDVRLLVGTHTHSDHIGLAEWVIEASGCEFLMHPDTAHFYDAHARARADRRGAAAPGPCRRRAGGRPAGVRRRGRGGRRRARGDRADAADPRRRHDRRVAGGGDARSRAHARRPVRRRDDHPRRPALPRLHAVVRLRLFERPGGRVPGVAGPRRGARAVRRSRYPATAGRSRTCPRSSPSTARGSRPGWTRPWPRSATARTAAIEISRRLFGDLEPTAMVWRLTETMAYLRHLRLTGAIQRSEVDGFFRYEVA